MLRKTKKKLDNLSKFAKWWRRNPAFRRSTNRNMTKSPYFVLFFRRHCRWPGGRWPDHQLWGHAWDADPRQGSQRHVQVPESDIGDARGEAEHPLQILRRHAQRYHHSGKEDRQIRPGKPAIWLKDTCLHFGSHASHIGELCPVWYFCTTFFFKLWFSMYLYYGRYSAPRRKQKDRQRKLLVLA